MTEHTADRGGVRYLLSLRSAVNRDLPPTPPDPDPEERTREALLDLVPAEPNRSCDMRAVRGAPMYDHEYLEVQPAPAPGLVGVLPHQPTAPAGVPGARADKAAAPFVARLLYRVASAALVRYGHLGVMSITAADENAEADILRVLRGNPNPAEVAALLVALAHVRARNAAEADPSSSGAVAPLPTVASWDRPQPVVYRSPSSWMRAA